MNPFLEPIESCEDMKGERKWILCMEENGHEDVGGLENKLIGRETPCAEETPVNEMKGVRRLTLELVPKTSKETHVVSSRHLQEDLGSEILEILLCEDLADDRPAHTKPVLKSRRIEGD